MSFKSGDKVKTVRPFNNNRGEIVPRGTKAKVFSFDPKKETYTILFDGGATGVVTEDKIVKRFL